MKSLEKLLKPAKEAAKVLLISGLAVLSSNSCVSVSTQSFSPSSFHYYPCNQSQNAKEILKQYKKGKRDFKRSNLLRDCLKYEVLTDINLSNSNLYQANLEGAALFYSKFNNTNFFWANLSSVKASYSSFVSANLYKAILRDGLFDYSNFSYADLRDSDLSYADFSKAKFRKVKFKGSNLNKTNFTNADLRKADLRYAHNLEHALGLAYAKYGGTIVTAPQYDILSKEFHQEKGIELNKQTQKLFDITN